MGFLTQSRSFSITENLPQKNMKIDLTPIGWVGDNGNQ